MKKKIYVFLFMFLISILLIVVGNEIKKKYDSLYVSEACCTSKMQAFYMGTVVSADIYGTNSKTIVTSISNLINELDTSLLSVRDEKSELYKLNLFLNSDERSMAQEKSITLSNDLYKVLSKSLQVCKDSNGALDITIRPIALLWGIDSADENEFRIPTNHEIAEVLKKCGYSHISLNENNQVSSDCEGMLIDLGAIGKGFALDEVSTQLDEAFEKNELDGATVSVGGSILVYGSKLDGSDWKIGIRDPFGSIDDLIGYLSFSSGVKMCISTSGNYEKYVIKDGKRYHHIFDINTGYPADAGLSSVTVVCEDGAYSDALSTACFTLGYEKSKELLYKYGAEGIFITVDGDIIVTDGLKNKFTLLK